MKEIIEDHKEEYVAEKTDSKDYSLDNLNEYLPVSFCPICFLFMCTQHLSASIDSNSWIFQRVRQRIRVQELDLAQLKQEKHLQHLKEWMFFVEQA